jgi:DNA-binding transcriptional ArsR family regulator
MRDLELALKAASDPTRTRILKLLESGGLCVCQVQAVLRLAPSTVSKHLSILKLAGFVDDRRDGRWIEYALVQQERNAYARGLLAMLRGPIDRHPVVIADRKRLREIKAVPIVELCNIAPTHRSAASLSRRHRVGSGRRPAGGVVRGGRVVDARPRPE